MPEKGAIKSPGYMLVCNVKRGLVKGSGCRGGMADRRHGDAVLLTCRQMPPGLLRPGRMEAAIRRL